MAAKKSTLTIERLKEVLDYNEESGVFLWKKFHRGIRRGSAAGSVDARGAISIRVDGVRYLAHRLAWLHEHSQWPDGDVDHIDGNPSNNAAGNLRDVPHFVNQQNIRSAHISNKSSGLLGVSLHRASGLWRARITVSGAEKCLGYFCDPQKAHDAYIAAKRRLHEGCTI